MSKKKNEVSIRSSAAEYLTYIVSVGDDKDIFEVRYQDENIWLTQKMLATLYDVKVNTINYHINKVFDDMELNAESVIRKFRITASDGKPYDVMHYGLQMIIAVGFKVNSERAVQFRKWVNQIAKDYTIKGWVMDDERLKQGTFLTDKYFEEQLARIREIRASERKFYQKITDIYATAIDYDKQPGRMLLMEKLLKVMLQYGLLKDAGKVTAEIAKLHAETEFEKYRIVQDKMFMSDYDRFLLELEEHIEG